MVSRILVPTDYSPHSMSALSFAAELARQCQAVVSLLHVIDAQHWMAPGADFAPRPLDVRYALDHYRQKLEAHAVDVMRLMMEEHGLSGASPEVAFGRTVEGILDFASSRAIDLICVSTHGRGALAHLLLGSTTRELVQRSPVPVLLVRSQDDVRPETDYR